MRKGGEGDDSRTVGIAAVCRTHLALVDPSHSRPGHGLPHPLAELPPWPVHCPGWKAVGLGASAHVCTVAMTYI